MTPKVRIVDADFETFSGCDLRVAGARRYAEDPTTEVLCLTVRESGTKVPYLWVPGMDISTLAELATNPRVIWVAHSAMFEKSIWRCIMMPDHGLPDIPDERWHDTQATCAMRGLPLDLERAMTVLRLPSVKDAEGRALIKAVQKPTKKTKKSKGGNYDLVRDPEVLKRIYQYNASDIANTTDLRERLGWLPPGERAVWLLDQKINQRGVAVDLQFVAAARQVVEHGSAPLLAEFATITGGLAPTQRDKFMAWLHSQGVHLDNLKKETLAEILGDNEGDEDADGYLELAGDDAPAVRVSLPPAAHRALTIRSLVGSAAIKKLPRMEACACNDGRIRGMLQYHGAGPGLWAGRLIQPQNFPRGSIQIKTKDKEAAVLMIVEAIKTGDPAFVEMVLGLPAVEAVVSALRHALVAAPGHRFVAGDYAGIQARVVLALAGQYDKVQLMASGADVYCDMASNIFRRTITKDNDPEERQYGKNSVLGLGFQMGARKFHDRYCGDNPLEFAQGIVDVYRKEWAPKVPKLWYALDEASTRAVWDRRPQEAYGIEYRLEDGWLTARLPSGRKLWYFNPVPVKKEMPWSDPEAPDIREGWTSQAMKMGRWVTRHMFGGLETENVVMGIQRDIMVSAAFRLEKAGFPLVLNVHDEWVAEPRQEDADMNAFKQILEDVDPWVKQMQIPVSVEVWEGSRYRK